MSPRARIALGLAALACYSLHAGYYLSVGRPQNLLWVCHMAAVCVGVGLLGSWPRWVGAGVLWLCYGFPLWILDLATGGEFLPTSLATHLGGLAIGLWALGRVGLPRRNWWRAAAGAWGVVLVTRLVAPPEDNVNLAFRVWPGWEGSFASYPLYLLLILGGGGLVCLVAELGLSRVLPAPADPVAAESA